MWESMNHGNIVIIDVDADDFWHFCRDLASIAANAEVVDEIKWHTRGETLTSSVVFDFDEDDDEYMLVGFITNNNRVYAEIDDGTYGNLHGLRVYTGRKREDVE